MNAPSRKPPRKPPCKVVHWILLAACAAAFALALRAIVGLAPEAPVPFL